jgi:DNA-binding NtrC family response regulator
VESHEVQPVGSSHCYKVDIRLVAATNRDLRAMVKRGEFRDDLFYRLNAAAIVIPPLRERKEAIPAFVAHFAEHYGRMFGKEIRFVSRDAIEALCDFGWPGNIRELSHAIESAILMTDTDRITLKDLPEAITAGHVSHQATAQVLEAEPAAPEVSLAAEAAPANPESPYSLDAAIREASKEALIKALNATHGNCHRAADLLGVSRYTVYRMLARYGMNESRGYRRWAVAKANA